MSEADRKLLGKPMNRSSAIIKLRQMIEYRLEKIGSLNTSQGQLGYLVAEVRAMERAITSLVQDRKEDQLRPRGPEKEVCHAQDKQEVFEGQRC